ncbi:MAG: hypothetical protein Q7S12_04040 [bacterium]|nr:hypothetical protein [bacterium]
MSLQKRVILIGNYHELSAIAVLLQKESFLVEIIERFDVALLAAKKPPAPKAIIFVLPTYWQDITGFVKAIGSSLPGTKFIYVGSLVEGADQAVLQAHNVLTFTLGPVPKEELARFITKLLW